eukprot:scaffold471075_cov26-Prasinocladus_malaysianus.AAC.1
MNHCLKRSSANCDISTATQWLSTQSDCYLANRMVERLAVRATKTQICSEMGIIAKYAVKRIAHRAAHIAGLELAKSASSRCSDVMICKLLSRDSALGGDVIGGCDDLDAVDTQADVSPQLQSA